MIIPTISFYGTCAQALDFYCKVFHAPAPKIFYYGEYVPEGLSNPPAGLSRWIMHAEVDLGGNRFWFADEPQPVRVGEQVKLTLPVATRAEGQALFDALGVGGTVALPPTETFYSTFHASLVDCFGLSWSIVAQEPPERQENRETQGRGR